MKDLNAEVVFNHWKTVLNHPRAILDKKRKKVIEDRLRDGFTVEDLLQVPLGVKNSPWHMGDNPRNIVYDSITLIYRDADQVEKFMASSKKKPIIPKTVTCQFCDWYAKDPTITPCERHAPELFFKWKEAKKLNA